MKIPTLLSARNWIIGGLLFLPMAYVLSIGPVARWVNDQDDLGEAEVFLAAVYAPLTWAMDVPVVGVPLELYCEMWIAPDMAWDTLKELFVSSPTVFVAVSPGVGVGIDFDVGGPVTPPPLPAAATASAGITGVRTSAGEEEPSSIPPEGEGERIELARAEQAAAPIEPPLLTRVVIPCPGENVQDAGPAFRAKAETIETIEVRDGATSKYEGDCYRMNGHVHLQTGDGAIELRGHEASVTCRAANGLRTTYETIQVILKGNARWSGGGFEAEADEIWLSLHPASTGGTNFPELRDVVLVRSRQIATSAANGKADRVEVTFDPRQPLAAGAPQSIVLLGNAALTQSLSGSGRFTAKAERFEVTPAGLKIDREIRPESPAVAP